MDSTASILIIFVVVGIIILGAVWALSRNRVSVDVPPAKPDDSLITSAQPKSMPAPTAKVAPSPSEAKQAPEPAAKPKSTAPTWSARNKIAAPKPTPVKALKAKKTAPKKTAAAPAAAAPVTAIGVPGAIGPADSLLQIKGLGPKLNTLLDGLSITRFDQIAAWSAEDVAKVDEHLGAFKGRIERDSWIEQAGFLAKGAIAEFEAKFGKLDGENK
jgi:predicted flap endonuclease-1-like 5' DNA nuclease